MKKSRLFLGVAVCTLAIGGFIAQKVSATAKVFAHAAYYQTVGTNFYTVFTGATASNMTTLSTSGKLARIKTANNVATKTLFYSASTAKPLYWK